jgi:hypothetical protein
VSVRRYCLAVAVLLTASCTESAVVDDGSGSRPSSVTPESGAPQSAIARFLSDPGDPGNWRWLCKAAAEGNSAAQYTVGVRYRDGLPPVTRDTGRAYRWFTAAVRNGLPAAAIARDGLTQSIPEAALKSLRADKKLPTEADCASTGG